jgi:hypothetical protein
VPSIRVTCPLSDGCLQIDSTYQRCSRVFFGLADECELLNKAIAGVHRLIDFLYVDFRLIFP